MGKKYGKPDTIQPDNLMKSEFCIEEMINADHQPTSHEKTQPL